MQVQVFSWTKHIAQIRLLKYEYENGKLFNSEMLLQHSNIRDVQFDTMATRQLRNEILPNHLVYAIFYRLMFYCLIGEDYVIRGKFVECNSAHYTGTWQIRTEWHHQVKR